MHLSSHLHRPNTKSHIPDIGEYQPVVSSQGGGTVADGILFGVWLALSPCAKRLMDPSDLHPWHSSCSHALVLWNQNLAARIFIITNKCPLDFCAHWINNRLGHKLNYVTYILFHFNFKTQKMFYLRPGGLFNVWKLYKVFWNSGCSLKCGRK